MGARIASGLDVLKVAEGETPDGLTLLLVEGQVAGPWVEELRRVAGAVLDRPRGLVLDLGGVSFLDSCGVELIRNLGDRGVLTVNGSPFVAEQLKTPPASR